jgi:TIR domain
VPAPPILEIYVVWHPDDDLGRSVGDWLITHFHGPAFAGLAGGAVEVYLRSAGWNVPSGPPRPLPFMSPLPAELSPGQITVVVPVLGRALARAVRRDPQWRQYVEAVFGADASPGLTADEIVAVYPLPDPSADFTGSRLAEIAHRLQSLPASAAGSAATLAREVAQAIAQRIARESTGTDLDQRVTVFVSHTKHSGTPRDRPWDLVATVRDVLQTTHLDSFFDAHDIQVAEDWEAELDTHAASHALLMLRTDLYASREWTQREVLAAKAHDIPIVSMYAVREEEQRGSFLMDHVPVIACLPENMRGAVERALNRLVDEALKRALWLTQRIYLERHGFDWLPVHAPEPVTLAGWLRTHDEASRDPKLVIMHPDPPLGPNERAVILGLCRLAGLTGELDILTPRTFATRGGRREP